MKYPVVLKDALHNASTRNVHNESDARYAKGVIVGAMAGIMAITGKSWSEARPLLFECLPLDLADCLPEGW